MKTDKEIIKEAKKLKYSTIDVLNLITWLTLDEMEKDGKLVEDDWERYQELLMEKVEYSEYILNEIIERKVVHAEDLFEMRIDLHQQFENVND